MAGFNGYSPLPGTKVGPHGSVLKQVKVYQPTLSPAAVNPNTSAEQTFSVSGLATDDVIVGVSKPTTQAGIGIVGYRVSAADVLAITFGNFTATTTTPTASQTYSVFVVSPYAL